MKVVDLVREVTSGGMKSAREFTVKAGAHMMSILSGLYKNPVEAIVREYLSNVVDAYTALLKVNPKAKIIKPILRCPSRLAPTLEFQDFGIGMDYDMVWEIYSQYGNSTKTDNNDEVGGFGLGSKTAFCYNGGAPWNITAVKNGIRNRFMAFVGEDGIPQLTHISEEATTDHSGVTISIPIRHQDVLAVIEAVKKYVQYFPMEITVEGLDKPVEPLTFSYKGKDWGMNMGKNHFGYRDAGVTAVVGNVPYKVATYDGYGSKDGTIQIPHAIINGNEWTIHLPIGSVDIVPSRDDLKYTDRTKAAILAACDKVAKEFQKIVQDEIVSAKTEWEVCTHLNNVKNKLIGGNTLKFDISWNGKKITDTKIVRTHSDAVATLALTQNICYAITNSGVATPVVTNDGKFTLDVADDENTPLSYIVIDNLAKGGSGVMRGLVRQKYVNQYNGRASRYGHKQGAAYSIVTKATKKQISDFFGGMPMSRILTTSDLKGVVPVIKGESEENIYRWDGKRHFSPRVNIPKGEKTYYYLPMTKSSNGRYAYNPEGSYDLSATMGAVIASADALGVSLSKSTSVDKYSIIYGVLEADIDTLDSNWKDLSEVLAEKAIAKLTKDMDKISMVEANENDIGNRNSNKHIRFLREHFKGTDIPNLKELITEIEDIEQMAVSLQNSRSLILNKMIFGLKNQNKISAIAKKISENKKGLGKNLPARAKKIVESNAVMVLMFDFVDKFSNNNYYFGNQATKMSTEVIKKNMKLVLDNQK